MGKKKASSSSRRKPTIQLENAQKSADPNVSSFEYLPTPKVQVSDDSGSDPADLKLASFLQEISALGSRESSDNAEIGQSVESGHEEKNVAQPDEDPATKQSQSSANVPHKEVSFWQEVPDPNTNHNYYWNPSTNEVSWTLPENGVILNEAQKSAVDDQSSDSEALYAQYYAQYSQRVSGADEQPHSIEKSKEPVSSDSKQLKKQEEKRDIVHANIGPSLPVQVVAESRRNTSEDLSLSTNKTEQNASEQPSIKQGKASSADTFSNSVSTCNKQTEQALRFQVSTLADELSRKLRYLHVSVESLSELQILNVQLQVRLADWNEGGLTSKFMLGKLKQFSSDLEQYEMSAAPKGWKLVWDRSTCRYKFHNLSTGSISWEFPEDSSPTPSTDEQMKSGDDSTQNHSIDVMATQDNAVASIPPTTDSTKELLPESSEGSSVVLNPVSKDVLEPANMSITRPEAEQFCEDSQDFRDEQLKHTQMAENGLQNDCSESPTGASVNDVHEKLFTADKGSDVKEIVSMKGNEMSLPMSAQIPDSLASDTSFEVQMPPVNQILTPSHSESTELMQSNVHVADSAKTDVEESTGEAESIEVPPVGITVAISSKILPFANQQKSRVEPETGEKEAALPSDDSAPVSLPPSKILKSHEQAKELPSRCSEPDRVSSELTDSFPENERQALDNKRAKNESTDALDRSSRKRQRSPSPEKRSHRHHEKRDCSDSDSDRHSRKHSSRSSRHRRNYDYSDYSDSDDYHKSSKHYRKSSRRNRNRSSSDEDFDNSRSRSSKHSKRDRDRDEKRRSTYKRHRSRSNSSDRYKRDHGGNKSKKKEKRKKKNRSPASGDESKPSKPLPNVLVGKVGKVCSVRTLVHDKKAGDEDSHKPLSPNILLNEMGESLQPAINQQSALNPPPPGIENNQPYTPTQVDPQLPSSSEYQGWSAEKHEHTKENRAANYLDNEEVESSSRNQAELGAADDEIAECEMDIEEPSPESSRDADSAIVTMGTEVDPTPLVDRHTLKNVDSQPDQRHKETAELSSNQSLPVVESADCPSVDHSHADSGGLSTQSSNQEESSETAKSTNDMYVPPPPPGTEELNKHCEEPVLLDGGAYQLPCDEELDEKVKASASSDLANKDSSVTPVLSSTPSTYQTHPSVYSTGATSSVSGYNYGSYSQPTTYSYNYGQSYSDYAQAYSAYVQQAAAASSLGHYYPSYGSYGTYRIPYTSYYNTGSGASAVTYQMSNQATSLPTSQVESLQDKDHTPAKKSEFALSGSKEKQMKSMIEKWSSFKEGLN